MTEAEWWAATDPDKLLDLAFYDAKATDRKLRLFSVACCNRVRGLVGDPAYLEFLSTAEAYADGLLGEAERDRIERDGWRQYARRPASRLPYACDRARGACLRTVDEPEPHRRRATYRQNDTVPHVHWITYRVVEAVIYPDLIRSPNRAPEKLRQVRLLHDIFGPLPFREVAVEPAWLTPDVLALARGVYDEKAFDRLPILADALQDAGCANDEILTHCRRADWEHVRGCWVLDLVLGRPWREGQPSGEPGA